MVPRVAADVVAIGASFWLSFGGAVGGDLSPRLAELRGDSLAVAVCASVGVLWLAGRYGRPVAKGVTPADVAVTAIAALAGALTAWGFARVVDPAAAATIDGSVSTSLPASVAVLHVMLTFLSIAAIQWLIEVVTAEPVRAPNSQSALERLERRGGRPR